MDESLVSKVKEEFQGYTSFKLTEILEQAGSVNEILHCLHSYVMNNKNGLRSLPKIAEKENGISGEPICLYGVQNDLAQKIFQRK